MFYGHYSISDSMVAMENVSQTTFVTYKPITLFYSAPNSSMVVLVPKRGLFRDPLTRVCHDQVVHVVDCFPEGYTSRIL